MTERDYDIERIMAIAEGTLTPDDAAAAELALDDMERAELAAQRAALAALADADAPSLTDAERHAMRSAIRAEIHLDQPDRVTRPAAPVAPWYARLLPALGGIALLVVVVGVGIGVANRGQGPEVFSEIGDNLSQRSAVESTTAAAAQSDLASAEAPVAVAEAGLADNSASDGAAEGADAGGSANTLAPSADFVRQLSAVDLGDIDPDDVASLTAAIDEAIATSRSAFPYALSSLPEAAASIEQRCWVGLADELESGLILLTADASVDGEPGEVYVIERESDVIAYVYVVENCQLIAEVDLDL
jgi:hypothetical protein